MNKNKTMRSIRAAVLLVVGVTLMCLGVNGCKTELEKGGAYAPGEFSVATDPTTGTITTNFTATAAPDKAFYILDSSYLLARSIVNAVMEFERDNRADLWRLSPDIKHGLDRIRPRLVEINLKWAKGRAAYLANPRAAGLSWYGEILAQMQGLASAAIAIVPVGVSLPVVPAK